VYSSNSIFGSGRDAAAGAAVGWAGLVCPKSGIERVRDVTTIASFFTLVLPFEVFDGKRRLVNEFGSTVCLR
jgi:hypothetical protein